MVSKPTIRELLDDLKPGAPSRGVEVADAANAGLILAERVEKVLALHQQTQTTAYDYGMPIVTNRCRKCRDIWPCATMRALDGE